MLNVLRRWLIPPLLTDDEQLRVARLLRGIVKVGVIVIVVDMLLLLIFAPETLPTFWINGLALLHAGSVYMLTQRGHIRAASLLLTTGLLAIEVSYLATSGGVISPAFGFLYLIVIVAGILMGAQGVVGTGLLAVVSTIVLYVGYEQGWLTSQEESPTPERMFATQMAILLGVFTLMAINANDVRQALARVRENARMLTVRNAELQREIAERERAQMEQSRLAAILEATVDFVGMADVNGHALYVNAAGRRLVGLSPDVLVTSMTIQDFHPHETGRFILDEAFPAAARDGTWRGETVLLARDGREIPVSQVIIAHHGAKGDVGYYSTVIRDLTERKQTEKQRLEMALQKERFESFRELLGNLSHDLRTPLAIINTSIYLMERVDDAAQRQAKTENIRRQLKLLEQYIEGLLALSRLDHLPELAFEPVDAVRLLEALRMRFAPEAEAKHITLRLHVPEPLPPMRANEQELDRALTNLLANAMYYTPENGIITLEARADANGISISVADSGIGISADDLPHIFDRFYRTHGASQMRKSGTGLGLPIVKRVVEVHSGTIRVDSTPGVGTTFHLWLPAA